jgi:hypothetical protein
MWNTLPTSTKTSLSSLSPLLKPFHLCCPANLDALNVDTLLEHSVIESPEAHSYLHV